ncbi:MAG: type II toxin-antitoxin system Phd/YefM family antitoxin [Spirulina sp.]
MIDLNEIHSLTDFQRNAKSYLQRAKESQKPIVLTVNGKAEAIVQDARAYQKLLDRLEYAESVAAIRQGFQEIEEGKGKPAIPALEELGNKYGFSR